MPYFAKLSASNVVEEVIVAPDITWCTTNKGGTWVETFLGHPTERLAGKGATYFGATPYKFVPAVPPSPPTPFVPTNPSGPIKMAGKRVQVQPNVDHNGFPALIRSQPGELMIAYRWSQYTHLIDNTAVHKAVFSTDGGATWTDPITIRPDTGSDPRDIMATKLSDGRIAITSNPGYPAFQAEVRYSSDNGRTFGSPATIRAPSIPYQNVVQCPIVEMPNGDYLIAVYGRVDASSLQSAYLMRSTDQGATWTEGPAIVIGSATNNYGLDSAGGWREPYLCLLANGDLYCGLRHSGEKFWYARSTDGGATWASPSNSGFVGYGRPFIGQLSNGTMVAVNRQDSIAWYRISTDNGVNWGAHPIGYLDAAYRMAYAMAIPGTSAKTMALAWSMEDPGQENAYLRFTYLYDETVSDPFPA